MKTILVDAWATFVTEEGIDQEMYTLLESYPNSKIILTNANDEEIPKYGLVDLPYELFTLKHEPNKTDPEFFTKFFKHFNLTKDDVVYFEHTPEAVEAAKSLGITSYHFDHEKRDMDALKKFLDENIE